MVNQVHYERDSNGEPKSHNKTRVVDYAKDIADLRREVLRQEDALLEVQAKIDYPLVSVVADKTKDPDRAKKIEAILCQHGLHQWARGRVEAQHVRAVLLALADVL